MGISVEDPLQCDIPSTVPGGLLLLIIPWVILQGLLEPAIKNLQINEQRLIIWKCCSQALARLYQEG